MKTAATVNISPAVIGKATDEQLIALRNNVFAEGRWDSADGIDAWWEAGIGGSPGTIMVAPYAVIPATEHAKESKSVLILMGIEKDGYTHS